MLHFLIAFLHGQLEVEDRLLTEPVTEPAGDKVRHPRRFFHHIAHQPVGILLGRTVTEPILAHMFDLSALHQRLGHGAVIHRRHHHAAPYQLIGPATGTSPQIHRIETRGQTHIPLIIGHEYMQRLLQLEGGATWCIGRKLEPGYAHMEGGVVDGIGVTHQRPIVGQKHHMQHGASVGLFLGQFAGTAQRLAQWHRELATEGGQLLGIIGIGGLHSQLAADAIFCHRLQNGGDTIGQWHVGHLVGHHYHLPGKDQLPKWQTAGQLVRILGAIALEEHIATLLDDTRKAKTLQLDRLVLDLGCHLLLESGTAIKKQLIHYIPPATGNRRLMARIIGGECATLQ